jgi:hypothetical protein
MTMDAIFEYMGTVLTRASQLLDYDVSRAVTSSRYIGSHERPRPARRGRQAATAAAAAAASAATTLGSLPAKGSRIFDLRNWTRVPRDAAAFERTLRNDSDTYPSTAQVDASEWAELVLWHNYSRMGTDLAARASALEAHVKAIRLEQQEKERQVREEAAQAKRAKSSAVAASEVQVAEREAKRLYRGAARGEHGGARRRRRRGAAR